MSLTKETWRARAAQGARRVGRWLRRRGNLEAPYLLYGGLCGAALWPVLEAARAGRWDVAAAALVTVAGSVGGNLLAEQMQRWWDRAGGEPAGEEQLARWVAGQAPADPRLRRALDDVLIELDVVGQAQAGLGDADRTAFARALRQELSQLGNLERFAGVLADVVVQGDVYGDVVTGEKITYFDQRDQQVDTQWNVAGDYVARGRDGDRDRGGDEDDDGDDDDD